MKKLLLPVILCAISSGAWAFSISFVNDTSFNVHHQHDGDVAEWVPAQFTTNAATGISYAVDNDETYLYIALVVNDISTQFKMMRNGMTLYVDPKGKKKEGKGIEFPVKLSSEGGGQSMGGGPGVGRGGSTNGDGGGQRGDARAMRNAMAQQHLGFFKMSGFEGDAPILQTVGAGEGIQVSYKCDTGQALQIEYTIPLALIGEIKEKVVGVGFIINGIEMPSGSGGGDAMGSGGMGGGSRGGGGGGGRGGGGMSRGGGGGNSSSGASYRDKMMAEDKCWTKYTLTGK